MTFPFLLLPVLCRQFVGEDSGLVLPHRLLRMKEVEMWTGGKGSCGW